MQRQTIPAAQHYTHADCAADSISFTEVARRLDATPELFVRLPKRDGLTRYRITSSAVARSHDEVEALLRKAERNESMLFYAIAFMVLAILAIVVLTTSTQPVGAIHARVFITRMIALRDTCADFAATHLTAADSSAKTRARVRAAKLQACSRSPNPLRAPDNVAGTVRSRGAGRCQPQ